jgi:hypothetical protein
VASRTTPLSCAPFFPFCSYIHSGDSDSLDSWTGRAATGTLRIQRSGVKSYLIKVKCVRWMIQAFISDETAGIKRLLLSRCFRGWSFPTQDEVIETTPKEDR